MPAMLSTVPSQTRAPDSPDGESRARSGPQGRRPGRYSERHHPSPEVTGGANGEVSWLRALRSPSRGWPQWLLSGGIDARHSGGAAPVLHRLPSCPVRV